MKILIILSVFTLIACGSPRDNMVKDGNNKQQKQTPNKLVAEVTKIEISYQWLKGPSGSIYEDNHLLVVLTKDAQRYDLPEGLSLLFYATMPSMGHPMEDAGHFKRLDTGIYINSSIKYNMPGDWLNEIWIVDDQLEIKDLVSWEDLF